MARNKSNNSKDTSSNYQSLYLWTSFLLGMISLGIIVWQRSNGNAVSNNKAFTRDDNFIVTYSTPLILSALTYQLSGNLAATLLSSWPLFFASPVAGHSSELQALPAEFRVNTYIPNQQATTRIARLTDAGFIITWSSFGQDNSSWGVYAQRYASNGTALDNEFRVNNYTFDDQSQSWPASLSDDSFVIVWHSLNQGGGNYGVYGKLYASDGTAISDEFLANMYTIGQQSFPVVFSNNQDEFLILWQSLDQDSSTWGVYCRYYSNNGTAISNEFRANVYTNNDQSEATAAALSNNTWVITWHSFGQDNSSYGIYAQIYINHTVVLVPEFRVNQFTRNAQMAPVVIHFTNDFIIIFMSQGNHTNSDYGNHSVYARHYSDNGAALGDEFPISFSPLSPWGRVSAAVLNQDYFVVIWKAYGNMTGNFDVYGRVCHSNGNCIGSAFQLNSYPSDDGGNVGGITLSSDSFVVTYDGLGHDPDGSDGVYARIIYLSDLNITLPTTSTTFLLTASTAFNASAFSTSSNMHSSSIGTILPETSSQHFSSSITATEINNTKTQTTASSQPQVTTASGNSIGIAAGAAAGAIAFASCLAAVGFYAYRKITRAKEVNSAIPDAKAVALKNVENYQQMQIADPNQQSQNQYGSYVSTTNKSAVESKYGKIDETKKTENEYNDIPKLEI
jgi:hypothetical protein